MASKRLFPGLSLRDATLVVRLNEDEHQLFMRRARELGLSLSAWARMTLRGEALKNSKSALRE